MFCYSPKWAWIPAQVSHPRNRVVQNFSPNTHSQAKTHRKACGGG
jgi:hypothetical protein